MFASFITNTILTLSTSIVQYICQDHKD